MWWENFDTFKKYAFRLERLQKYTVPQEEEALKIFKETGKLVLGNEWREWQEEIKSMKKRGARIFRVRVVKLPLSNYTKFEFEGYKKNIKAGDEVYLINENEFDDEIGFDYWMFDDKIVVKMRYDSDGRFLGGEEIKENIQRFIDFKNKIIEKAVPFEDFNI